LQKNRAYFGTGRVEIIANFETITSMINKGYTLTSIHTVLKTEGKLSISYSCLRYYFPNGIYKKFKILDK
jgi:hypothetical protein